MKKKFYQLADNSFEDLKAKSYKELWKIVKKSGYKGLSMQCYTKLKKADGESNKFHAVFSTAKEDRHGDIVEQDWELKFFKKNPVYLDSHNYSSIEHILGRIDNTKVSAKKKLEGDIVFAIDNPKGLLASKLVEGGFLNTSSVGFIPKKFDDHGRILSSELLEISAVSVPANPEALIEKLYDTKNKKDGTPAGENSEDDAEDQAGDEDDAEGQGNRGKAGEEHNDGNDEDDTREGANAGDDEDTKKDEKVKPDEKKFELDIVVDPGVQKALEKRVTFQKITKVVDSFCESLKVETSVTRSLAIEKRQLNRVIRKLIKLKKL